MLIGECMEANIAGLVDAIRQAKTISIIPHTSPDGDALGACFAFKKILAKIGKNATIYTEDGVPKYLAFLQVEHEVFNSDNIPSSDLCICIDCGDIGRMGERKAMLKSAKVTANIDHHKTNDGFADINIVEADASSAGEICYKLFGQMDAAIDSDIAMLLYTSIASDTGGFKYSNTKPETMRIAADLLEFGIDSAKVNRMLFDTESLGALKLKGLVSQNIRTYADGLVAVGSATVDMLKQCGILDGEIENIVDIVRCVEGVEVAVSLKESKKGIRVSMRSNEWFDVAQMALEFGGGGHTRAAGYLSELSIEESERLIVEAIIKKIGRIENDMLI